MIAKTFLENERRSLPKRLNKANLIENPKERKLTKDIIMKNSYIAELEDKLDKILKIASLKSI